MSLTADRPPSQRPLEKLPNGVTADPRGLSLGPRQTETLKIVVVGTPKTGNTWVKHLLADVYDLPLVKLKPEFDRAEAEAAGPRWVAHQHYLPKQSLLDWGAANNVAFVSVVRHPGDVLISLWHHMQQRRSHSTSNFGDLTQDASILSQGDNVVSEQTQTFVEHSFHLYLNLSIAWLDQPGTATVRYEDLWNCPVAALSDLTNSILPVSNDRLQLALCGCELGLMQSLLDPEKKLIRQGGVGGWRAALSPGLKNALITLDPYPAQFEALGYTMDERDPANAVRPAPGRVVGPFSEARTFADGTPITPVLMKAYFDLAPNRRERWMDPRAVSADSFFNWLNRPAAADPTGGKVTPVITELAHYIYRVRSDLRAAFPDPFGVQRGDFFEWFLVNARREYGLPNCFVAQNPFSDAEKFSDGTPNARILVRAYLSLPEEMRRRWPDPAVAGEGSFLAWLNSPAAADPAAGELAPVVSGQSAYLHSMRPPVITELAYFIYLSRSDLRAAFPDPFAAQRRDFYDWFLVNARREYGLPNCFVAQNPFSDAEKFSDGTPNARILVRAYLGLPEAMRRRWPDPAVAGEGSFLAWLNSPAAADPKAGKLAPVVTELGAYLHSIRPDVRNSMSDLYGVHRVDFANWFIASASREYQLDRSLALPVIRSWAERVGRVPVHLSVPSGRQSLISA